MIYWSTVFKVTGITFTIFLVLLLVCFVYCYFTNKKENWEDSFTVAFCCVAMVEFVLVLIRITT